MTKFRDARGAMIRHLHARYGISVEVASIEPPLKGDLDGLTTLSGESTAALRANPLVVLPDKFKR